MHQQKTCNKCQIKKNLNEFYLKRKVCKTCRNKDQTIYNRLWRSLNKEKDRSYHKKYELINKISLREKARERELKKLYNISSQEYNLALQTQSFLCAICMNPPNQNRNLAVDHNHITGKVRGLLCWNCNYSLGLLKEDINILQNMIKYIRDQE